MSSRDVDRSTSGLTRRFTDALARAEETGNSDELIALFSPEVELCSLLHHEPMHGLEGARRFWREYLTSFRQVRSRFDRVSFADGLAILEWVTEGTLASGAPISYRGVSLIEFDGDRVRSFRTYYDSAALGARRRPAQSNAEAPRH